MTITQPSIDIIRLEKVKRHGIKLVARCPACAAIGGDRSGTHFFQNTESGQFGCAAFPGDGEHRREIFALVGIKGERDRAHEREWKRHRQEMDREAIRRRKLTSAVRTQRATIIAAHSWTEADARRESPEQRSDWLADPRKFIAALFPPEAAIWTGEVNQSGRNHAVRWKTADEWQREPEGTVGPMITPAIWKPGIHSRSGDNVESSPYVVIDFDGFDGVKPESPEQLRAHLSDSMAIIRWMSQKLEWRLAAMLYTGGKSLHAWFHTPPVAALESLRTTAPALGIDSGLIGHPEHPCRLPGWLHQKTGTLSRVIWLQR